MWCYFISAISILVTFILMIKVIVVSDIHTNKNPCHGVAIMHISIGLALFESTQI